MGQFVVFRGGDLILVFCVQAKHVRGCFCRFGPDLCADEIQLAAE